MYNYQTAFKNQVDQIKGEGRYRDLVGLQRKAGEFPKALWGKDRREVIMWCINDYLGMSQHPKILSAASNALIANGAGSGGTRNIGGNNYLIEELEHEIATLHNKDNALVFTSGYVSNDATLTTLAKILPGLVFFSDELNHASMIAGISNSKAQKHIYKHLDTTHLEQLLQKFDFDTPKVIVFESAYSMDGELSKIKEICQLAKKYNALTYIDEVHSVGLYGKGGAGIANMIGYDGEIDIIQGTLAKAYGVIGGYIAANNDIINAIRLVASGFIFTTSLPPAIAAAAKESIIHLKNSDAERILHQNVVNKVKSSLQEIGINFYHNKTHIIPIIIGDPEMTRKVSKMLLEYHGIFIQHINFPTVPKGTERLRITPTPCHTDDMIKQLSVALVKVFKELHIPLFVKEVA